MNANEKAKELVDKFREELTDFRSSDWRRNRIAKQCALICVEEIITIMTVLKHTYSDDFIKAFDYWNEVKTEIEKL